jgi:arylsulfatase A-like enzyme
MRILYIDIDSLRPDHLGCYGYHRNTSPNIDMLAQVSTRFINVYTTDAPCAPSRSALWTGKFGFRNGVVAHGGTAGDPLHDGYWREFKSRIGRKGWMAALRNAGYRTATVSSFGERHSVWHWYAGFNDIINPGYSGLDEAHQVLPHALDWLDRHGQDDNWFLHVNFWDPHTPYSIPDAFGEHFADDPLTEWLTEAVRQAGWDGFGPHSTQEVHGWGHETGHEKFSRLPDTLDSMEKVKQWIDGYDNGIRYADDAVGQLIAALKAAGIYDETVIIVGADHGENQGELNIWGDHQTADDITCHVPLIVRWPGITDGGRVDPSLHYHFDWAATLIEMVGGELPDDWDGKSFREAFVTDSAEGRDYLITSQGAWAVQRGIRFGDYICLRTYHDGYKMLDPVMLFNLKNDPHEQHNLAQSEPAIVNQAMAYLADWQAEMMLTSHSDTDPLMTVLREGGPYHTRGFLPEYVERLRATGRAHHAEHLIALHPDEMDARKN